MSCVFRDGCRRGSCRWGCSCRPTRAAWDLRMGERLWRFQNVMLCKKTTIHFRRMRGSRSVGLFLRTTPRPLDRCARRSLRRLALPLRLKRFVITRAQIETALIRRDSHERLLTSSVQSSVAALKSHLSRWQRWRQSFPQRRSRLQ